MKKIRINFLLFGIILILSLVACGNSEKGTGTAEAENISAAVTESQAEKETDTADSESEETKDETSAVSEDASGSDMLVVYFSRTGEQYGVGVIDEGNTKIVADMIIDHTGADSFEIISADDHYPYTYDELLDVAKEEQNEDARPEYAGTAPDLSGYSTIFIGAPVWWGDWPMIMYTFFEENEEALEGKVLAPFCTHAGSGLSGFDNKLHAALPGSTVDQGLAITGSEAQNDPDSARGKVNDWLNSLGY